jgi:hypothetical protein
MSSANEHAEEQDDATVSDFGVGIDLRVGAISHAVSDGTDGAVIPSGENPRLPTSLQLTETGVSVTASADGTAPTVDVLPHYPATGGGEGPREQVRFQHDLRSLMKTAQSALDPGATAAPFDIPTDITEVFDDGLGPVVTVPGAYDETDREDVAEVLRTTGVDPAAVVRSPLAVAAAHYPSVAEPTVLAVVDIGQYWANIALVRVDPDQTAYEVLSRVSAPNLGRTAMAEAMAEWLVDRTAADLNREIEYAPTAFERITEATDRALEQFASNDRVPIAVSDISAVELEVGTPPIDIDRTVDAGQCDEALDSIITALIDECARMLADSRFDRDAIDGVLLAGSGSVPGPVANAVGNYFGQPIQRPHLGTERTAPALGAAVLATQWADGASPLETETLSHELGVSVPTADGLQYESVIPATASEGTEQTIVMTTTQDNQRQGTVVFGSAHPSTGDWRAQRNTYRITGLPPRPAGDIEVVLTVIPRENRVEDVSATIRTESDDDVELNSPLDVLHGDGGTDQWLRPVGVEVDADVQSDGPETPDTELVLPEEHSLSQLHPERAVGKIMNVRYNIWAAYDAGESVSPSSLESVLRQFDAGLRRINVEPIQPDPGAQKDRYIHRTAGTEPSEEHPEDTIIDVRRPGYKIDGTVEEPADVIVSEGPPERDDDPDEPDPETEVTDDDGDPPDGDDEETDGEQSPASASAVDGPQLDQAEQETEGSEAGDDGDEGTTKPDRSETADADSSPDETPEGEDGTTGGPEST